MVSPVIKQGNQHHQNAECSVEEEKLALKTPRKNKEGTERCQNGNDHTAKSAFDFSASVKHEYLVIQNNIKNIAHDNRYLGNIRIGKQTEFYSDEMYDRPEGGNKIAEYRGIYRHGPFVILL